MKRFLTILMILFLLQSCIPKYEDERYMSDTLIINEGDENAQVYDYYVDSYGNEGVVFYKAVEDGEIKCIIVISADESYEYWGPMDQYVYKINDITNYGVFSNYLFSLMMLQNMYAEGLDRFPAQKWCYNKNNGELHPKASSWRLPSYSEMTSLPNINKLNEALISIGGTPLDVDSYYWTCTEDYDGYVTINLQHEDFDKENRAILKSFKANSFSNKDSWIKKNKYKVRAIKYVYYHY